MGGENSNRAETLYLFLLLEPPGMFLRTRGGRSSGVHMREGTETSIPFMAEDLRYWWKALWVTLPNGPICMPSLPTFLSGQAIVPNGVAGCELITGGGRRAQDVSSTCT